MFNPAPISEAVIEIAVQAGNRILEIYQDAQYKIENKPDDSPVTSADLASHYLILENLLKLTPSIPVLSEESAYAVTTEIRQQWPIYWLVDPLDGTREFIKRNGEFTVNIALIENHVPIFGVIQQPTTGKLWYALENGGAWCCHQEHRQQRQRMQVRKPASEPYRVSISRSFHPDNLSERLAHLGQYDTYWIGSSLKFCAVAEGTLDIYPRFGPTSEWDTGAGQIIVESAGGSVVNANGQSLRYNERDTLLNADFIAYGDEALKRFDLLNG